MTDNIVFNLTPAEVPTIERKGSNERARQYDAIAAAVKAQPGVSFRAVEKDGTQAMVAALKGRGIWAGLRNTRKEGKTTFGDLYVLYEPTARDTSTTTGNTTARASDAQAPQDATPAPNPTEHTAGPETGAQAPILPADGVTIAGVPVDDDGMPIT